MKRNYLFITVLVILFSSNICSFNSASSTVKKEASILTLEQKRTKSSYLTVSDLDWEVGFKPRDWTSPLILSTANNYDYEINDTTLHFYETTGTYEVWVGAYAKIPLKKECLRIVFDGRAKANHIESVDLQMMIYHPETLMLIYYWNVIHIPGDLDSGFLSFDFNLSLKGFDEIVLFLGYTDGHIANWKKECWINNLKLFNEYSENDIRTKEIFTVLNSNYSDPRGICWKDGALYNLAGVGWTADRFFKYDCETGIVLKELELDYHPFAIANDEEYFWVSEEGNSILRKYDSQFNLVDTLKLSFITYGGLANYGEYLWITNYVEGKIYKINKFTGEIINSIPSPGIRAMSLEFDGEFLLACDIDSNKIIRFFPSNGSIVNIIELPIKQPWGITLDDKGYLWISNQNDKLLYKLKIRINADKIHFPLYNREYIHKMKFQQSAIYKVEIIAKNILEHEYL